MPRISTIPLTDFRGETVGHYILLRDITSLQILRDHEQRLSVVNRVLRHNIRNELNVVTGYSEMLRSDLSGEQREQAETITRAATRILEISEKATHVQATIGSGRTRQTTVNVAEITRAAGDRLDESHPKAAVHVEGPPAAWATTTGRDQLAVAVENIAQNAVEHNPADGASVWITVELRRQTVRIIVTDDGPGIPESEVTTLGNNRETALEHGSGLGLWLTYWIVDASNGDLSVETNSSTGSVITIDLPRTEPPNGASDSSPAQSSEVGAAL
ncbi:sensor histidine kinase [Haladaptatus sp. NG-SE-30]